MTEREEKEMNERDLADRRFYRAEQEASFAQSNVPQTPQTQHPAYRLAFNDTEFLLREELRPVRFQLELLKPEMLLEEAGVGSTLVMYGSARIPPPEAVDTALEQIHPTHDTFSDHQLVICCSFFSIWVTRCLVCGRTTCLSLQHAQLEP